MEGDPPAPPHILSRPLKGEIEIGPPIVRNEGLNQREQLQGLERLPLVRLGLFRK